MADPNCIIIGGRSIPLGGLGGEVTVRTWHDHGVQFRPGQGFNKRRRLPVELCVWHWTASENDALTMAGNLAKRGLGIEFAIDRDGTVVQFADPLEVDTADAGAVNGRSVGVEMVCYGVRRASRLWTVPAIAKDRPTYAAEIHGRGYVVAGFYRQQTVAALALADALSRALPIPRTVPLTAIGKQITHALGGAMLLAYRGHLGHFHVTQAKIDPGPRLIEDLHHEFVIRRGAADA